MGPTLKARHNRGAHVLLLGGAVLGTPVLVGGAGWMVFLSGQPMRRVLVLRSAMVVSG
jgi:hypothetical protein